MCVVGGGKVSNSIAGWSSSGTGLEEPEAWLSVVDNVTRLEYKMRRRYLRHARKRENLFGNHYKTLNDVGAEGHG